MQRLWVLSCLLCPSAVVGRFHVSHLFCHWSAHLGVRPVDGTRVCCVCGPVYSTSHCLSGATSDDRGADESVRSVRCPAGAHCARRSLSLCACAGLLTPPRRTLLTPHCAHLQRNEALVHDDASATDSDAPVPVSVLLEPNADAASDAGDGRANDDLDADDAAALVDAAPQRATSRGFAHLYARLLTYLYSVSAATFFWFFWFFFFP